MTEEELLESTGIAMSDVTAPVNEETNADSKPLGFNIDLSTSIENNKCGFNTEFGYGNTFEGNFGQVDVNGALAFNNAGVSVNAQSNYSVSKETNFGAFNANATIGCENGNLNYGGTASYDLEKSLGCVRLGANANIGYGNDGGLGYKLDGSIGLEKSLGCVTLGANANIGYGNDGGLGYKLDGSINLEKSLGSGIFKATAHSSYTDNIFAYDVQGGYSFAKDLKVGSVNLNTFAGYINNEFIYGADASCNKNLSIRNGSIDFATTTYLRNNHWGHNTGVKFNQSYSLSGVELTADASAAIGVNSHATVNELNIDEQISNPTETTVNYLVDTSLKADLGNGISTNTALHADNKTKSVGFGLQTSAFNASTAYSIRNMNEYATESQLSTQLNLNCNNNHFTLGFEHNTTKITNEANVNSISNECTISGCANINQSAENGENPSVFSGEYGASVKFGNGNVTGFNIHSNSVFNYQNTTTNLLADYSKTADVSMLSIEANNTWKLPNNNISFDGGTRFTLQSSPEGPCKSLAFSVGSNHQVSDKGSIFSKMSIRKDWCGSAPATLTPKIELGGNYIVADNVKVSGKFAYEKDNGINGMFGIGYIF